MDIDYLGGGARLGEEDLDSGIHMPTGSSRSVGWIFSLPFVSPGSPRWEELRDLVGMGSNKKEAESQQGRPGIF